MIKEIKNFKLDGIRSQYFIDLPLLSETATFTNTYLFKYFTELYENNVLIFLI